MRQPKINPLAVTMGIRDFKPCQYWIRETRFIDRLEIRNYMHDEAHQIARDYFLANPQYSHFLFLCEDMFFTPDHIRLLIKDVEEGDYPVISGWSNVDWTHQEGNISFRDMKNLVVRGREVYQHPKITDLVLGKHGFPIVKVWFMGTTLAMIKREVVEKLSFGAYTNIDEGHTQKMFGVRRRFGIMQDFQLCLECARLGIPIYVDLRVFCAHMVQPIGTFTAKGKPRTVTLYSKSGTTRKIREDEPYSR